MSLFISPWLVWKNTWTFPSVPLIFFFISKLSLLPVVSSYSFMSTCVGSFEVSLIIHVGLCFLLGKRKKSNVYFLMAPTQHVFFYLILWSWIDAFVFLSVLWIHQSHDKMLGALTNDLENSALESSRRVNSYTGKPMKDRTVLWFVGAHITDTFCLQSSTCFRETNTHRDPHTHARDDCSLRKTMKVRRFYCLAPKILSLHLKFTVLGYLFWAKHCAEHLTNNLIIISSSRTSRTPINIPTFNWRNCHVRKLKI